MIEILNRIRKFQEFLLEIGAAQTTLSLPAPRMLSLPSPGDKESKILSLFVSAITEQEILDVSRDLFASGHYSLAIQESFKAVEKYIQDKSYSNLNGTKLMELVFSPNDPLIYWTSRKKNSKKDEQAGYHRIYAGSMLGIRSPCTHEFNWVDDEFVALEILILAQHLLKKAKASYKKSD